MDEMTPSPLPELPPASQHALDVSGMSDVGDPQPTLPFEQVPVVVLPYDDEADAPIGFALTTRARRAVAADELPDLRIVPRPAPGTPDPDDPSDTRPARARALRRAGLAPAAIAAQLDVDDLLVRAWIDDVPVARRRGSASGPRPGPGSGPGPGPGPGARRRTALTPVDDAQRREERLAARQRLAQDPGFAAEVGLLAAIGDVEPGAVTLHGSRHALLGRALAGLVAEAGVDRTRVRVVLRVGSEVAGDLARHRWAEALALAPERIVVTRWAQAPTRDAVDALIRIPDATVATRVAGWTDALLDGPDHPLGLAF